MAEDDDSARPPTSRGGGWRRFVRPAVGALVFVLVAGVALAWYGYRRLDGNIGTDTTTGVLLRQDESERPSRSSSPTCPPGARPCTASRPSAASGSARPWATAPTATS